MKDTDWCFWIITWTIFSWDYSQMEQRNTGLFARSADHSDGRMERRITAKVLYFGTVCRTHGFSPARRKAVQVACRQEPLGISWVFWIQHWARRIHENAGQQGRRVLGTTAKRPGHPSQRDHQRIRRKGVDKTARSPYSPWVTEEAPQRLDSRGRAF